MPKVAKNVIFTPRIVKLSLKNVWLTRTLIRKEVSRTILQNEGKKESSSLIRDIVFLIF